MENIILTNNKDLRLVGVKVGVLSTLRFELPLVSASATHVEVIVTSGNVHSAYTATFIDATKRWQCDIAASQFPAVGRQSYEIAYVLDGKQFWDGKGWIDIADATTSGIEPQPRPEPYRYAVVSVNGYGADAQGAVRIPKTFITTDSPETTEGYIEGDICFNRETGATWTLCNVQGTLTWVFNYKNYYTKAETEEAIDRVAAYYITYDAAGNPFPTYAALANATTVYSGGAVRIPTRNDYCVVLADETHQGAEYRYIYAVAEGETAGSWQPQFPVEGVMTIDQTVQKNSQNPVSGGGVWSAIWGALAALPTGFSSLYDWVVNQLAGKVPTSRTVNSKALSSNVTLTGADIAVSNTDTTKIDAALAGKQSALSQTQLSNIAAVPNKLDKLPHIYRVSGESYGTTYNIFLTKLSNVTLDDVLVCYSDSSGSLTKVVPDSIIVQFSGELCVVTLEFAEGSPNMATFSGKPADIGMPFVASLADIDTASATLVEQIYDAVKNIAPAFASKAYALNDLCSYQGVVYRCKSAYTATAQSAKPDADTTHWEAKKVSDLFLPLTGGTMTGPLEGMEISVVDTAGGFLKLVGESAGTFFFYRNGWHGASSPIYQIYLPDAKGTLALLQNLAPDFSTSATYAVGKLCVYATKLYRCTTAVTMAGSWNSDNWTEVQDALSLFATLASPAFTGTPTAPTPTADDNSTKVATTAFVQGAVGSIKTFQHDVGGYYIEVEAS